MSAAKTQNGMNNPMAVVEPMWRELEFHLEKEKRRIFDEILHYPPPIPACDVQFNYLLEERARITQELRRMSELSKKGAGYRDCIRLIREFIGSSKFINDVLEAKLLSNLEKALDT